jgi:hypothetical protein
MIGQVLVEVLYIGFRLLIEGLMLGREVDGCTDGVGDTGIAEFLLLSDGIAGVPVPCLPGILLSLAL